MKDTPRTDAMASHIAGRNSDAEDDLASAIEHARTLERELNAEKADHADTQRQWNEALDAGFGVVAERNRLTGLLRLEELAKMAERRACEAVEAKNNHLRAELAVAIAEVIRLSKP